MKISIFLPVRKGSERVKDKNTRPFAGFQDGLLALKLQQLIQLEGIFEIVVSTNDEKCFAIAEDFQKRNSLIKVFQRPESLSTSETDLKKLIEHAGNLCCGDHILWTHVTSPLFFASKYHEAIDTYQKNLLLHYDSLITGRSYKEFLLDTKSGELLNNESNLIWPRTQDLMDLFEINNAVFLAPAALYKAGKRMGQNPFLLKCGKIASLDIDDREDFEMAEMIYERIYK